jgi:hypothetical protein
MTKPHIVGADSDQNPDPAAEPASETVETQTASMPQAEIEQLDDEEKEFRALRRDLPGVKGASAAGIVAISVGKAPAKNEFFRTHKEFRAIVSIVDLEVGMERQFFAVTADMVEALRGVGITVTDHVLYLTITARGAYRIVPVRQANATANRTNTIAPKKSASCKRSTNGAAVHRPREQGLQSFSGAGRPLCRSELAGPQAGADL